MYNASLVSDPADLGVVECIELLSERRLSSRELTAACLARIDARDGRHSFEGDSSSINAWVRVYAGEALASADRADARLAQGDAPPLCGVPIGLKDLYAAAGLPLTASSRVLDETPARDSGAWARLREQGMILLGHLHTHEFAAGGTTDQVGNPWALDRSAGGSSGGSAAALAACMTPAATGTDTAGSLRIPSAITGTSAVKPTRGAVPLRGLVPLAPTLDHAGPMARTVADCEPLLAAMTGTAPPSVRRPLRRVALSPRIPLVELDPDVAEGLDAVCSLLAAELVAPPAPDVELDLGLTFLDVVCTEMLVYHRRFDARRAVYRPSIRGFLEYGESRKLTAEDYVAIQELRLDLTATWLDWLAEHRIDALVEPTVPIVAHARGDGYAAPFTDVAEISLTHYWNWTGFPVVTFPSGVGSRSGLPVSVSLVGAPHAEWDLLSAGAALQAEIGTFEPSLRIEETT
jgi:aspartyl-tRNA(Asn)/glutamyl-tRNA(Gln) amidotransferase subunit A